MDMKERFALTDEVGAQFGAAYRIGEGIGYKGLFQFEFRNEKGGLELLTEHEKNIVVDDGINYLLANGASTALIYTILLGSSPTLAAGTSIGDITELTTNFSQSVRPTWVDAAGSKSITNSASRAHYDFTGALTIGGAALVVGSSTLGDTASTTLINGRALSGGNQVVASGWTLDLTVTLNGSDSGT